MIVIRRSEERGHVDKGWLNSFHTFSFADYQDPKQTGFRSLRVLNQDLVAPGKGFGAHGHRDMEIISYVVSGKLGHKDSMGHQEVLGPNEVQVMSAGSGVVHSEFNASESEPVHFLQIWIEPAKKGLPSSYQQLAFEPAEKAGRWKLLVAPEQSTGVAGIHQDASLAVTTLRPTDQLSYDLVPGRHAWVQVLTGRISLNGHELNQGDAAAISDVPQLTVKADNQSSSEVLLFDLA
jgi:redox-sensitive bicupin YhaK (pirin superfamily)